MVKPFLVAAALLLPFAARAAEDPGTFGPKYCAAVRGTVQIRFPAYGTNSPPALLLAGPRKWCQFLSKDGQTQINVLLSTLITRQPSLAALAYYAEVPYNSPNCEGSPGSCYCTQIGGTDLFGGINAAGGGWVLNADDPNALDACIFPDLSSIDTYGLFYHSANIIRGQNLDHKLRFKNPYKK
jgi:hypothetical protein